MIFEETRNSRTGAPAPSVAAAPKSPAASASWLLRTAAFLAVAAGIAGVVIAPGVRGNASEQGVVAIERASSTLGYMLMGLLLSLVLRGIVELIKSREAPRLPRVALVAGGASIAFMALPAMHERVPPAVAVVLGATSSVVCLSGAYCAARTPHTRALAGILCAFAFASIARIAAWELATRAGDTASVALFGWSRGLATAAVFFGAAGQLVAVTWLGTRGKWTGQLASTLALGGALVVTWSVASGVHASAAPWQAILHSSLADTPGVPSPYGFDTLATFLVPASLLLALVAAAQPGQVVAIVAGVALSLVSRGALDVPLCALCAAVAAQWAAIASVDERAMWRTLLGDRVRQQEEDGAPLRRPHDVAPESQRTGRTP